MDIKRRSPPRGAGGSVNDRKEHCDHPNPDMGHSNLTRAAYMPSGYHRNPGIPVSTPHPPFTSQQPNHTIFV